MTIANHLFHRLRSDDRHVSNTHCVPQPVVAGKKSPQRATEIVFPGPNASAHGRSSLSQAHAQAGEYPLDILINRFIQEQHAEIRKELLRLQELSSKVTKQEKTSQGRARAVAQLAGSLVAALVRHMNEEEKTFPSLLKLELAYIGEGPAPSHHKLARESLRAFSKEHDHYFKELQELTRKADSIAAPADAAPAEHDVSARLKTLHRLLLKHCYFEINVVFARAAAMETELFR